MSGQPILIETVARQKAHAGFTVNGERVEVAFAPQKTLLEVLREELGLTGTKHGCELGECGTCTVLVDGTPILSCLALAISYAERRIDTVEGMAQGAKLHPLQDAFAELGAAQCGYCTPGFLLAARALLDSNPAPTRDEIKESLSGNLCRCTGYLKIYEAVEMAAGQMRTANCELRTANTANTMTDRPTVHSQLAVRSSQPDVRIPQSVVGTARRKVDATAKVTGETKFADDLSLSRMLWCKLLRSREPHARILRIDTSRAEQHPGVVAVLTGRDLPIPFGILPISQDEHALCPDHVRFVGDPVAAVAAIDEDTAADACDLIEVEYDKLPPIESVEDALASGDTPNALIHDYGDAGNVHKHIALEFGNVDAEMATADHVREDLFFFEGNTHLPMEQHAALAQWFPDGKVTVWSSTQTPHYLHRALAKVLEMPAAHVRVIATPNGGGFGGKSDPFSHEIVVAALARRTGRPVKISLTREEVFYCHRGRHPTLMRIKTGVKRDGRIVAMDFTSFLDGGAYGSYGVASTYYTGALQTVTYEVPHYRFQGARVFTNKPPCGPKRGHGTPQPRFALECQLDKIAEDLSLDPAVLRKRILQPANSVTANWLRIGSMGLGECIDAVVERSAWQTKYRQLPFGRGVGLACSSYISGAGLPIYWNSMPHSGVQLKLDRSGGVAAFCGSTDIGQGSDSVLAYCVADVLGIEPEDIRIVTGDTDLTPVDLGSYSSRVTLMTGNAAVQAAERARDILADGVSRKLNVPKSRLVFADRRVFDAESPDRGLTFAEAVQIAEGMFGTVGTTGSYTPPRSPGKYKGAGVGPSPAYSYTAAVAEVEVDPETGMVRVPKIWIAHDVGRSINPLLVIGQVEGSVYMGLGEALMEEMTYRDRVRNVVHHHPSMLEYKSPTTFEMCDVETILVHDPDPSGPFGAKEAGQGPLLPVMPAVANAIYDAVGVRIDEIPCSPHKVLKALKEKMKGNVGRFGPTVMPNYAFPEMARVRTPAQGGTGREEDGRTHSEVGGPVEQAGETTAAAGPAPRKSG